MTTTTATLLARTADYFGEAVTWVMPEAEAGLLALKHLSVVHPFRPEVLALQRMKIAASPAWPENKNPTVALCLPRQVEWACGLLAQALDHLPIGGTLLAIAPNDLGGKRYAKILGEYFDLALSESKNHCRIVVLKRPAALPAIVDEWRKAYQPHTVDGTALQAMPGNFSHAHIDAGSALLVKHLPPFSGAVADFGAGWGFLSHHLLSQPVSPARVDLFEADDNALNMAKVNLAPWKDRTRFFWHDILTESTPANYDAVIMNPPFHDLREARTDIGRGFITAAARALKTGGGLFLVANATLPYEDLMKTHFPNFRTVCREGGFKVLAGVK